VFCVCYRLDGVRETPLIVKKTGFYFDDASITPQQQAKWPVRCARREKKALAGDAFSPAPDTVLSILITYAAAQGGSVNNH
jgi:hypothetical protein